MKKRIPIILLLIIALSVIYLNRSYAHIYEYIDTARLQSPMKQSEHELGKTTNPQHIYVAIGDSLTAGVGVESFEESYPYQLARQLSQKENRITLKTFAVPGAKSKDIEMFLSSVIEADPDSITILIGVNDVHGNISQDEFQKNYETILSRLTQETKAKIYIINLPYIGDDKLIREPYAHYFDYRTRGFNGVIQELSEKYSLTLVDLYAQTSQSRTQKSYYSTDLFHPSSIGYSQWAQILYANFNQ